MAEVERSIYSYRVEMADGDEWRRADVLRGLDALTGDVQVLALGDDNYAWAKVDHIPRTREGGRLRFFRDRRSNLPGFAHEGNIAELPIPEEAVLIGADARRARRRRAHRHRVQPFRAAHHQSLREPAAPQARNEPDHRHLCAGLHPRIARAARLHPAARGLRSFRRPSSKTSLRNAGPLGDAAIALSAPMAAAGLNRLPEKLARWLSY